MKNIGTDEIFLLSEIVDKMNVTIEIPDVKGLNDKEIEKIQSDFGKKLLFDMFRKMHKAKNEINKLIESLTGKSTKDMTLKEIKETLTDILRQDGILDFFK